MILFLLLIQGLNSHKRFLFFHIFDSGKGYHGARTRVISDGRNQAWEDSFAELVAYKKIHGDCDVKEKDTEYKALGCWVGTQRGKYRQRALAGGLALEKGGRNDKKDREQDRSQDPPLSVDQALDLRFKRLTEVGFNFVLQNGKRTQKK
jgi:hypothetical protein